VKFQNIAPLQRAGVEIAYIGTARTVMFLGHTGGKNAPLAMAVSEATALRDWLLKALPIDGGSES